MQSKNYASLRSEKFINNEKFLYADLLSTKEWREKREKIIIRDKIECSHCLAKGSIRKDKSVYRLKSEEEISKSQQEIDKAYENLLPDYENIMKSFLPINDPIPEMPKIEVDPLAIDLEPNILHVHHTYYIKNHLPWEYKDESLMTLCSDCHQKLHNETYIPIYENKFLSEKLNFKKCLRCSGSGYIGKYHYYMDGICFRCNGFKYEELIDSQFR